MRLGNKEKGEMRSKDLCGNNGSVIKVSVTVCVRHVGIPSALTPQALADFSRQYTLTEPDEI